MPAIPYDLPYINRMLSFAEGIANSLSTPASVGEAVAGDEGKWAVRENGPALKAGDKGGHIIIQRLGEAAEGLGRQCKKAIELYSHEDPSIKDGHTYFIAAYARDLVADLETHRQKMKTTPALYSDKFRAQLEALGAVENAHSQVLNETAAKLKASETRLGRWLYRNSTKLLEAGI